MKNRTGKVPLPISDSQTTSCMNIDLAVTSFSKTRSENSPRSERVR